MKAFIEFIGVVVVCSGVATLCLMGVINAIMMWQKWRKRNVNP